jgi:uncharacterized repeat protein (TIGR04076 family)
MENEGLGRRCFLGGLGAGAVMAAGQAHAADEPGVPKKIGCKITVLKRSLNQEYVDSFRGGKLEACPVFKEGQEFVLRHPWDSPQGFCDWAWADLRSFILATTFGRPEAFPPTGAGKDGVFVGCCSDGFRPVFFKIERTEV